MLKSTWQFWYIAEPKFTHSPRTMNLYCLQFRRRVRVSHHEHQSSETTLTLVTSNWLRRVNKICKRSKSVLENIDQRNTPSLYWTLSNPLLLLDLALVTFNKDVIYCFFFFRNSPILPFSGHIVGNLNKVIRMFHRVSCIRFVPYRGQKNYIFFDNDDG